MDCLSLVPDSYQLIPELPERREAKTRFPLRFRTTRTALPAMVPVGTWFVYWGECLGLPILLLLIGLAALFSL